MYGNVESTEHALRPLSWSRTVDRESVHRSSVAEVLLTDALPCGGLTFRVAAQWSRSHPSFPDGGADRHHPLMVAETLRQIGIHLPLKYFDVSPDAHFLIKDLYFALDPDAEPRLAHGATDVSCLVVADDVRVAPDSGRARGVRLRVWFWADGRRFARASGRARFVERQDYAVLRAGRPPAPGAPMSSVGTRVCPESVGVGRARDVMVSATPSALHVDPADPLHPFFFDHGSDHVPGMVLLEAARQAAAWGSGGSAVRPLVVRLRAPRFTEFAPTARVECTWHGTAGVSFRVWQGEVRTAVGAMRFPRHADNP
ncbi:ScbA/BarX family gamma-butyrolactone biosynthesis protein [Streptomyces sp. SID3343]|uniref:ScbA/BarX family gamma-butyrolactone biosynthesis protein n=1 Tax=Streptomyces sp. SID3343 TaxID=2690260 RepID=UPI00136E8DB4|nr:ScbA/BarX family gamma-butyrolactone biosynthesis protein [Streptomyces sp. SID3343]MYV99372.1 A-factor biosynthesis protein [Streptomyces sp. SID3343]